MFCGVDGVSPEQIKYVKIWIARYGCMSGNSVNVLIIMLSYICLFVIFLIWGLTLLKRD